MAKGGGGSRGSSGGGSRGSSGGGSRGSSASNRIAPINPNAPVSARVANATSSTGNRTPSQLRR